MSAIIIRRVMPLALAIWFIAFPYSVPALVQGGKVPSNSIYAGLSDGDLLLALNVATAGEDPNYCEELAPLLKEMVERGTFTGRVELASSAAEMSCAMEQSRWSDAYRNLLVAEKEMQLDDSGLLGFDLALRTENYDDAALRLIAIANAPDSTAIQSVDVESFFYLKDGLKKNANPSAIPKLFNGLFYSRNFNQFTLRQKGVVSYALLNLDAEKGQFDRPLDKLKYLNDPQTTITILSDRKFAPIWQVVEESAGPNMAKTTELYVTQTAGQYKTDAEDSNALQEYAHALLFAGRFEEVISLVDVKDVALMTEQQGWALNVKAYALDALGKTAESSAIFDAIAAIPYEPRKNDWLVSFLINRASRLSELGQYENALKANKLAESIPGSDYAKMLTLKTKICSLAGLNRTNETMPFVVQINENRKHSHATAAEAMLCVNEKEKAVLIVLEALASSEYSETMTENLQRPEFNLFYTRSVLPNLYDNFHSHSDIKAALYKVGQFIPDEYIPKSGMLRIKTK